MLLPSSGPWEQTQRSAKGLRVTVLLSLRWVTCFQDAGTPADRAQLTEPRAPWHRVLALTGAPQRAEKIEAGAGTEV